MQETQETWVRSLSQEDPLEEEMATYSSILAWKFHGQSNPAGYSPWSNKELDMTEHTQTNINIPHLLYPFLLDIWIYEWIYPFIFFINILLIFSLHLCLVCCDAVNIGVCVSFQIMVFSRCMTKSKTTES